MWAGNAPEKARDIMAIRKLPNPGDTLWIPAGPSDGPRIPVTVEYVSPKYAGVKDARKVRVTFPTGFSTVVYLLDLYRTP